MGAARTIAADRPRRPKQRVPLRRSCAEVDRAWRGRAALAFAPAGSRACRGLRGACAGPGPLRSPFASRLDRRALPLRPPRQRRGSRRLAPRMRAFHNRCRNLPQRPGAPSALSAGRLLHQMPQTLAARLARCLAPLATMPAGAIHGDLNAGNVILTPDGPALIDWDEARRDALCLDHLALGQPGPPAQRRAALAWEIACCWGPEPARARRLARGLIRSAGRAPIP